jgi:hypothetical protein
MAFKTANNTPSMTADGIPYIWTSNGGDVTTTATLITTLNDPLLTSQDRFGGRVAVGYGRVAIAAYGSNSSAGQVYLYDQTGTLLKTITSPNSASYAGFGSSVSIGSGRLVISQPYSSTPRVYVYDLNGNLLTTISKSESAFGVSISVGSGKIVVGSFYNNIGQAYIYDLNGNLLSTIVDPNNTVDDFFGGAVAAGAGRIVVSSLNYPGTSSYPYIGRAYVYDLNGNLITTLSDPENTNKDYFGQSVAIGSGRIIIGAYGADINSYYGTGRVYIYDLNGNLINILYGTPGVYGGTQFGYSVAVGSGRIIVGANFSSVQLSAADAGGIFIYDLDGNFIQSIFDPAQVSADNMGTGVAIGSGVIIAGGYPSANYQGIAYLYSTPQVYTPYDAFELTFG